MSESHSVSFWDREVHEPIHSGWMSPEAVRFYVNERVSGDAHAWPLDWFQKHYPMRFARALSIGCGTGALERDLVQRGIVTSIDAFDGSVASIAIAQRQAPGDRIRYYVGDFNRPALPPERYDAVFMHQSLHHVEKLEKLFAAILRTLKPGGLLYLDEYIGPSRSEWNEANVATLRAMYRRFPPRARRFEELPMPVQPDDPTEAIRSGEIMRQLAIGFDVEEYRGYGGAILSIVGAALDLDAVSAAELNALIDADRHAHRDFYAVVVARPKRRVIARTRYFIEPKLKRIGREVRRLASSRRRR